MRKLAFVLGIGMVMGCLSFSALEAQETRAAKIKRLQAEAKMARLRAQAEAERVAAYEEAWRKTKTAAKGAACIAGSLYAGPAVAVVCYAHDVFKRR